MLRNCLLVEKPLWRVSETKRIPHLVMRNLKPTRMSFFLWKPHISVSFIFWNIFIPICYPIWTKMRCNSGKTETINFHVKYINFNSFSCRINMFQMAFFNGEEIVV